MRERMGSGGPRGLQILRSDACVRGGFDSHAFPPLLLAALLAALSVLPCAGPAAAQGAAPDSAARLESVAPADSAGRPERVARPITVVGADTVSRTLASGRRPWPDQPRFVMLRSLLIPGWGQVHNRAWLKAVGVAGAEGWIVSALLEDNRVLNRLLGEIDAAAADSDEERHNDAVNRYNARLDASIGRQWLLGGVLAYALVDAYVDAHFRDFDIEFRHDPALPEQLPADPDAPKGAGRAGGGRTSLALRWHF